VYKRQYLFLGDGPDGQDIVQIDATGWSTESYPPESIRFLRPESMGTLPRPERGGSLDELRQFVNLPDDADWILYVAFLLQIFNPYRVPFPILLLHGIQGSGKSRATRYTQDLVDPNKGSLQSLPHDEQDLLIQAKHRLLLTYDNVSRLAPWQSDAFCRLATEGSLTTRTLYTISGESIFTGLRPVIITGIEDLATRGDFLDRALTLTCPFITGTKRRTEQELNEAFEEARPRILGALLDLVVAALRNYPATKITELPRMADFARWATAGLDNGQEGKFMAAYRENIKDCLLYTSPSPRDLSTSRMPSSA